MASRGVVMRTVASALGVQRGPAAPAGPRPRGGHSLARRCVAAALGVRLPPAAGPVAKASPYLRAVHGSTVLDPVDHRDPPEFPLDLLGPPQALAPAVRPRLNLWPGWLLVAVCAAAVLATVMSGIRPFTGSRHVAPATQGALLHLLPSDIQRAGKITVGTAEADLPPMVFTSDGSLTGLDVDLLSAMGSKLGIVVNYRATARTSLLSDVQAGRFDLAAAGFSDTPSRALLLDFVDYFSAGSVVTVATPNPHHIRSVADLCGKTVAVVASSSAAALVADRSCGADKILTISASASTDALDRVRTEEADASFTDAPSAEFAARQPDSRLTVVGQQTAPGLYGFAVSKHDPELRQALKAALDAIIDDGTYARILKKYHLSSGAVSTARVNSSR